MELVIEATGAFTTGNQAAAHLLAGAGRVLVTAPCKGGDVTLVAGVNERDYHPAEHQIISAASCTTNALAPIAKVLHERFGVRSGMMNTIHSYTNDQRILDRSHQDPRRAQRLLKILFRQRLVLRKPWARLSQPWLADFTVFHTVFLRLPFRLLIWWPNWNSKQR